ncbi:MAG: hypothetical protein ACQKBY_00490 [Verrucomicrobiales bacterium]
MNLVNLPISLNALGLSESVRLSYADWLKEMRDLDFRDEEAIFQQFPNSVKTASDQYLIPLIPAPAHIEIRVCFPARLVRFLALTPHPSPQENESEDRWRASRRPVASLKNMKKYSEI